MQDFLNSVYSVRNLYQGQKRLPESQNTQADKYISYWSFSGMVHVPINITLLVMKNTHDISSHARFPPPPPHYHANNTDYSVVDCVVDSD